MTTYNYVLPEKKMNVRHVILRQSIIYTANAAMQTPEDAIVDIPRCRRDSEYSSKDVISTTEEREWKRGR